MGLNFRFVRDSR